MAAHVDSRRARDSTGSPAGGCPERRWQIFGSARIPLNEMVKIDYLYGANWSLWLDMKILLRTVPFVVGQRGL
ncbi:MAG: sugar transferase [Solirubrobacterales bacterium]